MKTILIVFSVLTVMLLYQQEGLANIVSNVNGVENESVLIVQNGISKRTLTRISRKNPHRFSGCYSHCCTRLGCLESIFDLYCAKRCQ